MRLTRVVAIGVTAATASVVYYYLRRRHRRKLAARTLVEGGMLMLADGDADGAVVAFDNAVALDRSLQSTCWQRGLALFFAGRYREAAEQFERDLATNGCDVEEVVFHALSVAHATGSFPTQLLPATGSDPRGATMEAIRALYAGTTTTDAVLAAAAAASSQIQLKVGDYSEAAVVGTSSEATGAATEAMCYANYYIGCWHEAQGDAAAALPHFAAAAASPSADYMGRIAGMHHKKAADAAARGLPLPSTRVGGYTCPKIIVGGWQLSSGHSTHPEGSNLPALRARCVRDLTAHAAKGLVAFDFGDIYSGVEVIVGRFVCEYVASGGNRSSLKLHTKLVPDLDKLEVYSADDVRAVVERSCSRLQTSYVDLVQFHWWSLSVPRYVEVALALTKLRDEGLVREIGPTNFALTQTREMVEAGVPIVATQVQLSLLDRRVEATGLSAYCKAQSIAILPYGVLAGGLLSDRYLNQPPPPNDPGAHETRSLTKYLLILEEAGGWAALQALLTRLRTIADGANCSIADLAVGWVLSREGVGAAIVGARGQAKVELTAACARLQQLPPAVLAACTAAADECLRPVRGDVYELERDREGKHGRIMRYNLQAMEGMVYANELSERVEAAEAAFECGLAAGSAHPAAVCVAATRFQEQLNGIGRELKRLIDRTGMASKEDLEALMKAWEVMKRVRASSLAAEAVSRGAIGW